MATASMTPEELDALRMRCHTFLPGQRESGPGDELIRVGEWCRTHGHRTDRYGEGPLIESFEARIATLMGKEAGVFMPSGTMAQQIALRIWAEQTGIAHVGMHPTSHLELHEERGYARLHRLDATLVGATHRPTTAPDLERCPERLAALLVELPAREIGGQLPSWDELVALSALARSRGVYMHMDGARLWEAREAYAPRTFADIGALFDSIYVSFYKGIGALSGAMLLGPAPFIRAARVWRRRHGGTLVQLHPAVASAAMRFDDAIVRMPAYRDRALTLAAGLATIPGVHILPSPPQTNMFHLHVAAAPEAIAGARNRIAEETGVWLTSRFGPAALPGHAVNEMVVGDGLLNVDNAVVVPLFANLFELARAPAA
ncbi:MAG: beta-eliminating lyase-related protein [Betaproteobacteria bacterium]